MIVARPRDLQSPVTVALSWLCSATISW